MSFDIKVQDLHEAQALEIVTACILTQDWHLLRSIVARFSSSVLNKMSYEQQKLPALWLAISRQCGKTALRATKKLVEMGADPFFKDIWGNSWLFYCCKQTHLQIFKYLCQKGISLNQKNTHDQSILFIICKNNEVDLLVWIIQQKIELDVNLIDCMGRNSLFYAAEKGHLKICKLLIKLGSQIIQDNYGRTAIHYAYKNNHLDIKKLLQEHNKSRMFFEDLVNQNQKGILTQYQVCYLHDDNIHQVLNQQQIKNFLQRYPEFKKDFQETKSKFEAKKSKHQQLQKINLKDVRWQSKALKIVRQCLKKKGAVHFAQPVNQQRYAISNYYEIIKFPMDFSTIKKKLKFNGYRSSRQFQKDIYLIFDNCLYYNGYDHIISDHAISIRQFFQKNWDP